MDSQDGAAAALRYHGGNLDAARRLFPHAPLPWIDLSTGINPCPLPGRRGVARRLDAAAGCGGARGHGASGLSHAGQGTEAVAAPGAQALIQWLPRVFPARRVGILGFTYGEHATCWRAAGADVATVTSLADLAGVRRRRGGQSEQSGRTALRPRRPGGRGSSAGTAWRPADRRRGVHGSARTIRTAWSPTCPPAQWCSARLARRMDCRECGSDLPWDRRGTARGCGQLWDRGRYPGPRSRSANARSPIKPGWPAPRPGYATRPIGWTGCCECAGFAVVGGTPLFRLVQQKDAACWFKTLCASGILTRPFQQQRQWLRFAIPHAPEAWTRLEAALVTAVGNGGPCAIRCQSSLLNDARNFGVTE